MTEVKTETEFDELAERCERAAGPDRRLDAQIEIAFNPTKQWIIGEKPGRWPREAVYGTLADLWEWATDENKEPPEINAPRFTSSIEAAVSLVAPGPRRIEFGSYENGTSWAYVHTDDDKVGECDGAASEALAICVAALRVRT